MKGGEVFSLNNSQVFFFFFSLVLQEGFVTLVATCFRGIHRRGRVRNESRCRFHLPPRLLDTLLTLFRLRPLLHSDSSALLGIDIGCTPTSSLSVMYSILFPSVVLNCWSLRLHISFPYYEVENLFHSTQMSKFPQK